MTDEQINAAIAEACGWTEIHVEDFSEIGVPCFITMGLPPKFIHIENAMALPNYCNDLNAMHEAEKVLTDNQFMRYSRWIESFMQSPHYRSYLSASARQRAEAFLRTLGKWEEVQG